MTETALTIIDPLTAALAEATEAGDIHALKGIASVATGLQSAAKARGLGIDAENKAAEVVIRAERAMGAELARMAEDGERQMGGRYRGTAKGESEAEKVRLATGKKNLAELGITYPESFRFQMLARIPEEEFEARFGTVRDSGARIAKVDFYRLVKPKPEQKPEAERDMHGDGLTPMYAAFSKAAQTLIPNMGTLPGDELRLLAADITALVTAYNAERARR